MRPFPTLFAAAALLLVAGAGFAQPVVLGANGQLDHGATFVLTGTRFGEKAQAAPLRWDTFDGEQVGAGVLDISDGGQWDVQGGDRQPTYSNTRGRFGGDVCVLQQYGVSANQQFALSGMDLDSLYVHMWVYRDDYAGTARNSTNQKLWGNFATMNGAVIEFPQSRFDTYWGNDSGHMQATECGGSNVVNNWGPGPAYYLDQWFRLERYMAIGDLNGGNGYSYAKANLQTVGEIRGNFNTCPDRSFNMWSIGHYFQPDNGAVLRIYISEVYIDTTPARIELGDAPTWNACTRREIQIPQAWQNGSVSFEVNTGLFASGQQVYAYVVDGNDTPSNGFPVTIGEAHTSGDEGPPGAPTDVRRVGP